jgi:hypothetical protein
VEIVTTYPAWLILICILVGLIYAGALYFKDKFNQNYGSQLASILGLIRFLGVAVLCFFLLKPLIKSTSKTVEKPIIIVAQDNSQSLMFCKDSAFYKKEYLDQLRTLTQTFGEDYDVRTFSFGDKVAESLDSISYSEKLTNFSSLFDELYTKFSGRNIGAVVVASDGIYNKGSNPLYALAKLNIPIYTVALGDTTVLRDILVSQVNANELAYYNNKFPVRIVVEGRKAKGEQAVVTVSKKDKTLFTQTVAFDSERFFQTIDLSLDAAEVGLQKYTVTLSTISNEVTTINNRKDFFIDVLDSRQKILVLAAAPHPDVAAIQQAIESNEGYSCTTQLAANFKGNLSDYSLVIFHQLPSAGALGKDWIQQSFSRKIPSLFVWGALTDFRLFNELNIGYALKDYRNNSTDASAAVASGFSLFAISETASTMFRNLPPLSVPFGEQNWNPGIMPFLHQQIGQIATNKPLISFHKSNDTKTGLIAGEGIWRWRLTAFKMFESHEAFNELVVKTVQFLASKEDRSFFRVNGARNFQENEPVVFDVQLYNNSYEPLPNKEIQFTIKNSSGKEFKYTCSPDGNSYALRAGLMPVDNYTYTAKANNGAQNVVETGEFSVRPLQLEAVQTVADHRLLFQLANDNKGSMVNARELNQLPELIKAKKEIVSVAYENKELNDLIDFKWILILLIALFSTEWLLRKRAGTY